MPKRSLRDNALSSLMSGAAPARRATESASPSTPTDSPPEPAERGSEVQASEAASTRRREPKARTSKSPPKRRADRPAPDGYVGKSQYRRKKRGVVTKVAVHLSPAVATALRRAGAVGDANGSNMSEIVETLLVRAGYADDGS